MGICGIIYDPQYALPRVPAFLFSAASSKKNKKKPDATSFMERPVSLRDFSLGHMAASNFARSRALNGTRAGSSTSLGRGASTAQVAAIPAPVPIK